MYGKLFHHRKCICNTSDNDSIVLEKCNFVLDKSLKSPGISFWKKCGNKADKTPVNALTSTIIFGCFQMWISCPLVSDEFDYGISALLDMCIVDHFINVFAFHICIEYFCHHVIFKIINLNFRFTELFVDELESATELQVLVAEYLKGLSLSRQQLEGVVKFYLQIRNETVKRLTDGTGHRPHYRCVYCSLTHWSLWNLTEILDK